ncbi:DUF3567 family protein [Candidatus Accumulibacter sp. ACC003]|uniref:DUF3567 family protein n=1 Tax=Candidatus Accumulibacter sp. ACC003 TaxID=2823334 RepID=UPI0025C5F876|nr:DUF3567 family protein [Candidatus Accumulibacter sp. ACC003]
MNVVYNSANYAIVAYPPQHGFELVDKTASRSLYVQGSVARELRRTLDEIPGKERDEEAIDAVLDAYCAGAARPIVVH